MQTAAAASERGYDGTGGKPAEERGVIILIDYIVFMCNPPCGSVQVEAIITLPFVL